MTQYIEYVKALYLKQWSEAKAEALRIIDEKEASIIVDELTLCRGWRERVAASDIIAAFNLHSQASALIHTFENGPESYTCSSFTMLIKELPEKEQLEHKSFLLNCCPEGSSGDHLRSIITRSEI